MTVETKNVTLTVENVELDIADLEIARCVSYHPITRERSHQRILNAVIRALDPKDRELLEAHERGNKK